MKTSPVPKTLKLASPLFSSLSQIEIITEFQRFCLQVSHLRPNNSIRRALADKKELAAASDAAILIFLRLFYQSQPRLVHCRDRVTRPDPRPQVESTLHWVPVKTGGAILHWPKACQFYNRVPALLSPLLGWVAYCLLFLS